MRTIMLFGALFLILLTSPLQTIAQFQNILISSSNFPNEPSIAFDPKDVGKMVAGANTNNVYISTDTGRTWQVGTLSSTYGVWGDPNIIADTAGDFYFFHLSAPSNSPFSPDWIDRIVCQKMTGVSGVWNNGSYMGLNGSKEQDKEWVTVDRQNNNIYVSWTQFDNYGSADPADSSLILFSRSIDNGGTWSSPVRLSRKAGDCIDSDSTVEGATPCIGANGEVFVAWAGPEGIFVDRSLDHGITWLDQDIFVTSMPGGWDYDVPGINRTNGLPFIASDLSGGPHHGTIYINWTDQRNGSHNTDVFICKSTDGGNTWSAPFKVNTDNIAAHQFYSSIAVDQLTGYIYIVFYDRRHHTDNHTDVFLAYSTDGGQSFENKQISSSPFLPYSQAFFGDYTSIAAHGKVIRPIWGRTDGMYQSIWTADIDTTSLFAAPAFIPEVRVEVDEVYPNPFHESSYISFKLKQTTRVTLTVCDVFGRVVATVISNEDLQPGKYVRQFDPGQSGMPPGVYFFNLHAGDRHVSRKILYANQ
ncbi:MAG: T9SS type A sorting domain-containing protein [Sphingobacteriales bacterium]|nr:MAG: T9SS type A sorting domain-containing protein [Sphingobacteriales bacterium]